MSVIARFYVSEVTRRAHGNTQEVKLQAATRGKENATWAHYTPSGSMSLMLHPDTAACEWFAARLGKEVSIIIDDAAEPRE